jgi:hypothetical protein
MLWLLLVAAALILGRTYIWSILLWWYGRAGQSVATSEPTVVRPSPAPTAAIPPFLRPPVAARAAYLPAA